MRKIILLIVASALIICALGCNNNSNQTPTAKVQGVPNSAVATVDGLPISKAEYQSYLHNNFGDKALMALASQKILEAWAKEEGVTPTKEQIDKFIEDLKYEGQYDSAIEALGEDGVNLLMNDQLLKTNISKKLNPPTEEEIKEMYNSLKEKYVHGPRKLAIIVLGQDKGVLEEVYKEIENDDAEAIEKKVKELSEKYDADKKPRTGTLWIGDEANGIPEEIHKAIKDMKLNDISKVGEIKGDLPIYYIVKIKATEDKVDKKLEDVKDEIADNVAYYNSQYKEDFRNELAKRTENAKIIINIDKYKDLADFITHPNPMGGMIPQGATPPPAAKPAPAPAPKKK
ncbi:MAG: peptidyl-prolyl cis-trans isomerase [Abditibacteriota bacterium]|nr:peptidyl-prolyl cis-trans isomerase [Abditibacteriota bacterium]